MKKSQYDILWLDDELEKVEETMKTFKQTFKEEFRSNINVTHVDTPRLLLAKEINNYDFIFLDILLKDSQENGIDLYKKIRKKYKKSIIVFVSANLESPKWQEDVDNLVESDKSLFELPIPFPNILEDDFKTKILKPTTSFQELHIRNIYQKDLDSILSESIEYREKLAAKILTKEKKFVEKTFRDDDKLKNLIIGDGINNILYKGYNGKQISQDMLFEVSKNYNGPIFGFNRIKKNGYNFIDIFDEKYILSREIIPSEIIEFDENSILLNCLINPENKEIQIRNFDIEPFKEAFVLEKGKHIDIEIITKIGKRIFNFIEVSQGKYDKYFKRKDIFSNLNFSAFTNPKSKNN